MAGKKQVGWIKLERSIQASWLWEEKPFNQALAWIDLILIASWQERKDFNLNIMKPGEIIISQRELADRWGWGRQKVREFLAKLEHDEMITQYATQRATKLTLCNYMRYQSNGTHTSTQSQPTDNPLTTHSQPSYNNKKDKNEEECIIIGNINFKLSFVEDKKKLFPMLDVVGEIRKCVNWHSSKGRKIKDWNKAVSNWLSIAFDRSGHTGEVGGSGYQRFIKFRSQK